LKALWGQKHTTNMSRPVFTDLVPEGVSLASTRDEMYVGKDRSYPFNISLKNMDKVPLRGFATVNVRGRQSLGMYVKIKKEYKIKPNTKWAGLGSIISQEIWNKFGSPECNVVSLIMHKILSDILSAGMMSYVSKSFSIHLPTFLRCLSIEDPKVFLAYSRTLDGMDPLHERYHEPSMSENRIVMVEPMTTVRAEIRGNPSPTSPFHPAGQVLFADTWDQLIDGYAHNQVGQAPHTFIPDVGECSLSVFLPSGGATLNMSTDIMYLMYHATLFFTRALIMGGVAKFKIWDWPLPSFINVSELSAHELGIVGAISHLLVFWDFPEQVETYVANLHIKLDSGVFEMCARQIMLRTVLGYDSRPLDHLASTGKWAVYGNLPFFKGGSCQYGFDYVDYLPTEMPPHPCYAYGIEPAPTSLVPFMRDVPAWCESLHDKIGPIPPEFVPFIMRVPLSRNITIKLLTDGFIYNINDTPTLIGGKPEPTETMVDALCREAFEEVGWVLDRKQLILHGAWLCETGQYNILFRTSEPTPPYVKLTKLAERHLPPHVWKTVTSYTPLSDVFGLPIILLLNARASSVRLT
jgi:hypothetical protein